MRSDYQAREADERARQVRINRLLWLMVICVSTILALLEPVT